ncbi:PorV/PorQ family protein [uncultured Porphyromonas sp.]|uniref:PorV/PorQ family protein n=1 Tax=uncultured Porphyromonas sp. TaxID=159274 RepID=UPI0026287B55|nr:PorV/PorQ family protein [uncultured Porphyromonas sp.]
MNKKASILLLAVALGTSAAHAQKTVKATRSLPILEYATSARTAALGGNHYGETDVDHLYTNPTSLLYQNTSFSVSGGLRTFGKIEGLEGSLNLYNASLGLRVGPHAFFGGIRYFGGLKFTPIDKNEHAKKSRNLYDYTADLGYAYRFGIFSIYAKGSYIYTDQGSASSAVTFGGGAFVRSSEEPSSTGVDFILGAKVDNLGPGYKQSSRSKMAYPPAYAGLGGEIGYGVEGEHHLSLGAGLDYFFYPTNSSSAALHFGGEYLYHQMFALRAGYQHDTNGVKGFSAGLGLRFKPLAVDASYLAPTYTDGKPSFLLTVGLNL